ncbi:MAG: TatD family hydrolase [Candidatus Pacebacteria bacterium]|nr:TatD family hydrolase [Candidatus Paceibacterota bacterium]
MPKYIDIHSHINFKAFDEDRDAVIRRALDNNTWVINVGTQYDTSKKAVEMTNDFEEGVYAIIGLHPIHTGASYHDEDELGSEGQEFTSRGEIFDKEKYRELASLGKVVGIGECGLDYYRCTLESIEKQKTAFIAQIELANELGVPLMLHIRNNDEDKSRNAYADSLELLKKYSKVYPDNGGVKGDVHFFAGSLEDAIAFTDFGFTLSFTGVITYTPRKDGKGCNYEEIIKNIPLDMIMTDTDSPYVAPVPYRGKRNEPVYVNEIVKKIAEIKGLDEEEVAIQIVKNIRKMFNI